MLHGGLLLVALLPFASALYVSHVFNFPSIPYSAGLHHIHSPAHCMEVYGFVLPGFEILETSAPKSMGDYVSLEFFYKTYFHGRTSARVFSSMPNTRHILLMDPDGVPCLLGRLSLEKYPPPWSLHSSACRPAEACEAVGARVRWQAAGRSKQSGARHPGRVQEFQERCAHEGVHESGCGLR